MRTDAICWVEHESLLLENNPQKDPSTRTFPVYLPPDYNSHIQYPSFYYLSGWGSRGASLLQDRGPFAKNFVELCDALSQKTHPFIVVFPDCTTRLGSSQFINSEATGPYMDYVCKELVAFIDQKFSTQAHPSFRGVFGHSSGGFGAMMMGMKQSDTFSHIASFAGDCFFSNLYGQAIGSMIQVLEKYGSFEKLVELYLVDPNPMKHFSRQVGETIMMLNMCQCYLPNVKNPLLLDLYFDPYTGKVTDKHWQKLLAWDPIENIEKSKKNLQSLQSIVLYAGLQDEYGLQLGHRQFSHELQKHKIQHQFVEFKAGHSGYSFRMIQALETFIQNMDLKKV